MAWLSRISASTQYFTGIAMPMALLGIGVGIAFTPLTAAGHRGSRAGRCRCGLGPRQRRPAARRLARSRHPHHGLRLGQPQRSAAPLGRRLGPRRSKPRAGERGRHLSDGLGRPASPGPGGVTLVMRRPAATAATRTRAGPVLALQRAVRPARSLGSGPHARVRPRGCCAWRLESGVCSHSDPSPNCDLLGELPRLPTSTCITATRSRRSSATR